MSLRIYNTLTRQKEIFEPLQPGRANVYVCGPTVYDLPHIGHAKTYVSFDVVIRYLRHLGLDVLYVQNITDVGHLTDDADAGDDKIQVRARQRRLSPMALVETCTREFFEATDQLGCLRPDISPRATGHIPEMVDLIQQLIARGHAYESEGNVYFDVESFRDYGKLSNRRLEEQEAGGRVEPGSGKRNPADFALWKSAEGTNHSMRWNSPWGIGFPGWHIECSAMAMKYLGQTLDIHGAGVDNVFPHNEDEIAQSECATGHPFVRYWMHNGTVLVAGEKMSKSKGNFKTVAEEIDRFGADVLRFWVVSGHYRSPIDYTDASMQDAAKGWERLQTAVRGARRFLSLPLTPGDDGAPGLLTEVEKLAQQFHEGMEDDFNTPVAVSMLFGMATELNRVTATAAQRTEAQSRDVEQALTHYLNLGLILGLNLEPSEAATSGDDLTSPLVELLLSARQSLRKAKDFASADAIRGGLNELGITVEDRPEGATWRVQR